MATGQPYSGNDGPNTTEDAPDQRGTSPLAPESGMNAGGANQAKQKGGQVADKAKQTASQATDRAKEAASQATDRAKGTAGQLSERAQETAVTQLGSQKQRASDSLENVAQMLSGVGQQMRQSDQGQFAQYADRAADQVRRASGYLREHDVHDLVADGEQWARQNPAVFLVGAFALGALGARFLKSSSSSSASSRSSGQYGSSA